VIAARPVLAILTYKRTLRLLRAARTTLTTARSVLPRVMPETRREAGFFSFG